MNENTMSTLIGDVPVAEQLGAALERMALKEHTHSNYVTHDEIEDLKKKIDMLMNFVGDTPVSNQISEAINNIK